jgi:CRP/FNR family transcriptional regulator, cyclic AMP receptor protein
LTKIIGINLSEAVHGNPSEAMHMTSDLIIPDERVLNALHKSRLTENLLGFEINVLVSLITVHYFEAKEIIADLDDESTKDALMILVEGKIEVSAMVGHEPVLLLLESPGDLARIMSFVGNDMMDISAKVKIWRDSAVLLLQRSKLESLLQSHPSIVYCVMRNLVRHVHGVARRKNAEKEELSNYFYGMHGRY